MSLTPEQLHLATLIDDHVNQVVSAGGGDDELIASMLSHMAVFKRLMSKI